MGPEADSTRADLAFCTRCGARLVDGACADHATASSVPRPGPAGGWPPSPPAETVSRAGGGAGPGGVPQERHAPLPGLLASTEPVPSFGQRDGEAAPANRRWLVASGAALVLVALVAAVASLGQARGLRQDLDATTGRLGGLEPLGDRVEASEGGINGLSRRVSGLEAARDATPDTAEVAARVQRSVFTVVTDDGEGSGWVVAGGRVVTNFHVVSEGWVNDRQDVTLRQDDNSWPGRVIDVSPADDLAVIEVDAPVAALERAPGRAKVGDPVLAVGSPLGLGGTVSSGIVSAYRSEDGLEYLQFSAPVSPGNSGGPVVDAAGRVIGISVAKYVGAGAEGLSFAIPIERACAALSVC